MNVFLIKSADRGFFRVRDTLTSMGKGVRVRTSLFRGVKFPLGHPLPKRLDPQLQAYTGLSTTLAVYFSQATRAS